MNRLVRGLMIFLLAVLASAILFAGYATFYPITFTRMTPVLNYQRDGQINYSVQVQPNDFSSQTTLGMDQVYLKDFTEAIDISFKYRYQADRTANLEYAYQVDAILQATNPDNNSDVLLSSPVSLIPVTTVHSSGSSLQIDEQVRILPTDYDQLMKAFAERSDLAVNYVLAVTLTVRIKTALQGGPFEITDTPALLIPLDQDQYRLTRFLAPTQPVRVRQRLTWQLVLAPLPLLVYPVAAGVCFILIIVILTTTCSPRKNRFDRKLRQMLRMARSRLLIIGAKAWEPEWCVLVSDFRSMVRTARKLKHPLFCYIDRISETPAAYFYVYYGENNYCYTFGNPGSAATQIAANPDVDRSSLPDEFDDSIPVLPEDDDNPEIVLAKLRVQTN